MKYGPGISHNLCTKVRRELDEICLMTGSWDALSTGMTELSPGKRRLTRGFEGWRGEGAEKRGTQGRPPAAAMLCQGSPRPREESCKVAGLLQTPVWPYEPPPRATTPSRDGCRQGFAARGLPCSTVHHSGGCWQSRASKRGQDQPPATVSGTPGPCRADCDEGGAGGDGPGLQGTRPGEARGARGAPALGTG